MLFDTLKRKNKAEQEEQEWNANRPADYVSQNKEAMDALTGEIGSGYDGSELAKAYQQYRDQTADAAAAAADNTRANAAALSSGYGNSWADSLGAQGQGAATANVDAALTALRSRALSEYKNRQSGLVEALSGMGNTEALDRSAYGSNLSNWYNRQNFLSNQSAQARNENDNYWNNLWNGIRTVGNVAKSAYDGYMGYTQQQWENEFAEKQFEAEQERMATNKAFELYKDGYVTAADQLLQPYGKTSDIFTKADNAQTTFENQMEGLQEVISLASKDQIAAAKWVANYYNLPEGLIDYSVYSQPTSGYSGKSGSYSGYSSSGKSSGKSSGSSGSSGAASGYTTSNLMSMAKEFSGMNDTDPLYSHYKTVLTDAGWLEPETVSGTGSYKPSYAAVDAVSGAQKANNRSTGAVGKSGQTISRAQVAANAAKGQWKKGADLQTIYNSLRLQGYSEAEIEQALNALE